MLIGLAKTEGCPHSPWLLHWIVTLTCFGNTWIPALGSKTPQPAMASVHEQAPTQASDHNIWTIACTLLRPSTSEIHNQSTSYFAGFISKKTHLNCLELLKPISQRSKYATSGQRKSTTEHWDPSCCLRTEDQDLHHRTVSIVLTGNFKLMLQKVLVLTSSSCIPARINVRTPRIHDVTWILSSNPVISAWLTLA